MSNEIIFKKCDSRLYLEHQVESNDNYSIISPKINLEEFNSDSVDSHISDSEFEDHFFGDHQDLVIENNIEISEKSVPALPNKLFSGTKKVLNVISWINDKIGKPIICLHLCSACFSRDILNDSCSLIFPYYNRIGLFTRFTRDLFVVQRVN